MELNTILAHFMVGIFQSRIGKISSTTIVSSEQ